MQRNGLFGCIYICLSVDHSLIGNEISNMVEHKDICEYKICIDDDTSHSVAYFCSL